MIGLLFFFFFQAEDGIRDLTVTGVQTCALPICAGDGEESVVRLADNLLGLREMLPNAVRGRHGVSYRNSRGWCVRDRKSVVWGKSVDLGGRRIIKKKKKRTCMRWM